MNVIYAVIFLKQREDAARVPDEQHQSDALVHAVGEPNLAAGNLDQVNEDIASVLSSYTGSDDVEGQSQSHTYWIVCFNCKGSVIWACDLFLNHYSGFLWKCPSLKLGFVFILI